MHAAGTWLVGAIVATEAAFWLLLLLGLAARYVMKLRRTSTSTSTMLLLSVPAADIVLIRLVGLDLAQGTTPTSVHGLAAVYLGFSHHLITRVDPCRKRWIHSEGNPHDPHGEHHRHRPMVIQRRPAGDRRPRRHRRARHLLREEER